MTPFFPPLLPDDAVTFRQAGDGWPLRSACFDPPAGVAGRGSLLFLSGRADHIEKYTETMRDWAARGWAVESFDWRGQGGSGRIVEHAPMLGHIADFEQWLADLEHYAARWRVRMPGPHVIIGHSMGGHLLLRSLAEGRVAADAAVLVAPMIDLVAGGLPHGAARRIADLFCSLGFVERPLWPERSRTPERETALQGRLTHSPERFAQEREARLARPDLAMDAPSWGWLRAAYQSIERLQAPRLVETVETPVLILASRADRLVAASAIEALARRLPQGQAHFYGAEAAHEILREADPVRNDALARIDAFLDEAAPPPSAAAERRR